MRFKRLLALLLAAALALAVLVGCGGGQQSAAQALLKLLDGQYQNVSVEIDSDLEAKLRQAISESETDEELRAALEQLLGGGISFQRLGSGQQGDSAWTLIIYPGTDPDAAARSVYLDLDKVFAALPADGVYSSGFAMAEMENGYAILVKATVDKAGTEDKPDPVTLESIAVTTRPRTTYWVGESFDPAGMVITATYSNNTTKTISDITASDKKGVSWTPDGALAEGSHEITITYGGKTTTVSVTVEESTVKSIEVSGYTSTYTEDELFSPNGMTVTVNYTYGAPKTITGITHNGDQGVTWEPADALTTGTESVKITYTEAEKGSASIKVGVTVNTKPVILTDIVATWPSKTYYEGDTLNKSEITVEAHYSGSSDKPLNSNEYELTIEGPNEQTTTVDASYPFSQKGSYTLTVSYTDNDVTKTDTTTIKVEDKGYEIEGSTYKVSTAHGLEAVAERVNDGSTGINITLTSNIDLTGEWTPIGTESQPYTGTFDGNNHTITGLKIDQSGTDNVGLIGYLGSGGKVQDVTLTNISVSGANCVGGIAGQNYGTVENCSVNGTVTGKEFTDTGGIAGSNYGTLSGCSAEGTVTGSVNVGGIAGGSYLGVTIEGCHSTAAVSGISSVGGVVGNLGNGCSLMACYSTGNVTTTLTTSFAGGVVGINSQGTVTACYHATGTVSGQGNVGGVVGDNHIGTVTACYWENNQEQGTGSGSTGGTEQVTDGDWQNAVAQMNAALSSTGWRYELTGTLPTLTKN